MGEKKCQVQNINFVRENAKYKKIICQDQICDIIYLNFKPQNYIKKISANQYIKLKKIYKNEAYIEDGREKIKHKEIIYSTGEVYEMEKYNGKRNVRSLRKIFNDMKYLINSNFSNKQPDSQLFITLTYAENITDAKKLYYDFNKFMITLKRHCKEHVLSYIVIVEPQERGALHCHLLLKSLSHRELYIEDKEVRRMWGQGITQTKRLGDVDNIGSYFVAYMDSRPVSDDFIREHGVSPEDIKTSGNKKFIKGNRIDKYKEYTQIYRHSRNVNYPVIKDSIHLNDMLEEYDTCTYTNTREIEIGEGRTMKITKEQRRKL
jgi:hypothetical protein